MVMVDGEVTVNGRDRPGIEAALRQARARKPLVTLRPALKLAEGGGSGVLTVGVSAASPRVENRDLLVVGVLRQDGVVTKVESGENKGEGAGSPRGTRRGRRSSRQSTLSGAEGGAAAGVYARGGVGPRAAGVAVFVQDKANGRVYQAADLPWQAETPRP